MKYWNSYHVYWDTKIDKWYTQIMPLLEGYFLDKSYGPEVEELQTIINCSIARDVTQTSKFNKKAKLLFLDIVIPYDEYMGLVDEGKKKECIAIHLLNDMQLLSKFKPKDFNLQILKEDFDIFFRNIGWLK